MIVFSGSFVDAGDKYRIQAMPLTVRVEPVLVDLTLSDLLNHYS